MSKAKMEKNDIKLVKENTSNPRYISESKFKS